MAGGIIQELLVKFGVEPDKKSFEEAKGSLDSLVEKAKEFAKGLLALEGIKKLGELVMGVAENAERLALASQELGIGTEQLQKYEYAAKLSGVSTDELNLSFRFLLRNMGQAAEGSKEASKAFGQLGISVRDSNGKLKTVDQALPEIADKFQKIEDPAKRVRIAMELFGRAGARMIPFLLKGRAGLAELGDEAKSFGAVLTEDQIEIGEGFIKNVRAIGQFFQGIKNAVGIPLLKHLDAIASKMREWMKINGELIRSRISAFFDALGTVIEKVAQLTEPFIAGLLTIFKALGEVNPMLLTLATILGAIALAFGAAALGPVLLAAAIALVIEDIYGYFTGKNSVTGLVVQKLGELWDAFITPKPGEFFIVTALKKALIWIKDSLKEILNDFAATSAALVSGDFQSASNSAKMLGRDLPGKGVVDTISSGLATWKGYENRALGAANDTIVSPISSAVQSVMFNAPITIHTTSEATAEDIAGHVKTAISDAYDELHRQTYNALVPGAH